MATYSAWVSVVVKSCYGQKNLFPRSIVKCSWDDRFGSLLVKIGGHDMEGSTITNIVIAKTETFTDPTHIVPAYAPIILCEQFNYFHACLYVEESSRSMETESVNEITRIKESDIYTCGSILFPPGSKYEKSIIVREALTCNTTIETQYYGAKLVSFPPICYHCGLGEEYIVSDEELKKKICCCISYLFHMQK